MERGRTTDEYRHQQGLEIRAPNDTLTHGNRWFVPKKFSGDLGRTLEEAQNEKGQKFRFVFASLVPVVPSEIPNFDHLPDTTMTNEPAASTSETQPVAEEVGWEDMYIDDEPAVTAPVAGPSGSATSVKSETETKATSSNVEMIGLTSEDNDDNTSGGVENGEANVEVDGGSVVKRTRDLRRQRGQRRRRRRLGHPQVR